MTKKIDIDCINNQFNNNKNNNTNQYKFIYFVSNKNICRFIYNITKIVIETEPPTTSIIYLFIID